MKTNFLIGVGVGVLGVYLYTKFKEKAKKPTSELKVKEVQQLAEQVITEEADKYGSVLQQKYDIQIPVKQMSKKLKQKAKEFTDRRYAIKVDAIQKPVEI